jgi:periplasmic protein TonB
MKLKVKLMKRPPDMTDDEISKYMNFEQVLQKRNALVKTQWFYRAGYIAAGAVVVGVLLYRNIPAEQTAPEMLTEQPARSENRTAPATVPAVTSEVPATMNEVPSETTSEVVAPAPKPKSGTTAVTTRKEDKPAPESPATESIYIQAEPVSGYDSLFAYFRANLHYPTEAIPDSVQGVLTVSFVIDKQGSVDHIEFPKTLGAPFEKEALKLIEKMPPWKSATLDGKPVASKVSLPLTFELVKIK